MKRHGFTETQLTAVQTYAQMAMPAGVRDVAFEQMVDLVRDNLVFQLRAHVFGQEGPSVTAREYVTEARFPRWLPKWLRRRWSKERTLSVSAQGLIVYPDMILDVPKLGRGVRIVRNNGSWFE